ncbi:hypothetical protein [Flavobacterium sp.]|uniref:hypothetical protein n=1 Tax=Flavobacterium sp. TaxID=239 RepID=UPI002612B318|nr:hypothetical protein [Flavobacterium sp.]
MKKVGILLITIFISVLLASLYGALHDQITYSISSEYFTIYKFDQFGFQDWGNQNPRLTTALIGVLATWWVGLFIGIFQGLVGLIHNDYKLMLNYVLKAIFITLGITIIFGIIGFLVEYFNPATYNNCCFPYSINDGKNFKIVGSIHNYGYVGGEIGAFVGIVYQIIMKKKELK